jgi:hypothetical protein
VPPNGIGKVTNTAPCRNTTAPWSELDFPSPVQEAAIKHVKTCLSARNLCHDFVDMACGFLRRLKRFWAPPYIPLFLLPAILVTIISWNYDTFFAKPQRITIYGYASGISGAGTCDKWQGAEDVVVVMKTGASEIEKLSIHLQTTFRCAPNVMVFSDMAQQFEGMIVHDPLRHLVHELNETDPDLRYYLSLRERRRNGEDILKGNNTQAWALDRYKNLPMLQQAYLAYPNAHWFFFMDADTALIWPNLLTWLSQMDPFEPRYIGSSTIGGDDIRFAHGGTGYIVSHASAKIIAEQTMEEEKKSFNITKWDCCGDSALAKAFRLHDVLITPAFPNVNGESLYDLEYSMDSLCFAMVTMHHMGVNELTELAIYQNRMPLGKVRQIPFLRKIIHLSRSRPSATQTSSGFSYVPES